VDCYDADNGGDADEASEKEDGCHGALLGFRHVETVYDWNWHNQDADIDQHSPDSVCEKEERDVDAVSGSAWSSVLSPEVLQWLTASIYGDDDGKPITQD